MKSVERYGSRSARIGITPWPASPAQRSNITWFLPYLTGHGCARQIWEAYSEIVRSLENFPEPAILITHF